MKKLKVLIVLTLCLITDLYSQDFNYRWIEETGEVTSFEKVVIHFNYVYTYDMDFEKKSQKGDLKASILIEKPERYNNGRLVMLFDDKRDSFKILSCFYKTYKNSSEKYYQFKCEAENGVILYYNLDMETDWTFWMNIKDKTRMYFIKTAVDY